MSLLLDALKTAEGQARRNQPEGPARRDATLTDDQILTLAEDYPELLADEAKLDRLIGEAHVTIGTAILKHWHFSEELIRVVQEHENLQYQGTAQPDYVDLILVANLRSDHNKADLARLDLAAIPAFSKLGLLEDIELEMAKA